jgi:hypothetical protein
MGLVLLASVFILTEKNVEGRSRSTTSIWLTQQRRNRA